MAKPRYSYSQFLSDFPTEESCLEFLFKQHYGHLKDFDKYYRVRGRKVYAHSETGHQISPTANTIFHKSRTPLMTWFYVIFLFSCSRNGISSYEIERQTGVTHKTAWRMGKKIRELFAKKGLDKKLQGTVEADETYIGGKEKNKHHDKKTEGTQGRSTKTKEAVVGVVERGGDVVAQVVTNTAKYTVQPFIKDNVKIGSNLMTDEYQSYNNVSKLGYNHQRVEHGAGQYVSGEAHTNTLEGFWSQMKRSIDGTHHMVSPKYLQEYINEFVWKYNRCRSRVHLFEVMINNLR